MTLTAIALELGVCANDPPRNPLTESAEMLTLESNMKLKIALLILSMSAVAYAGTRWHTDNQVAAGEWKIEVQTPPCDSYKNIQVIYPKESGAPITIECDLMPVAEK
jgi:hypothetical protein